MTKPRWVLGKPVVEDGFKERAAFVGITSYVLVMCLATLVFWWWHRYVERSYVRRA